jgi:integrase
LNHPIPKVLQRSFLTASGKPQTHVVRALGTADPKEAYLRKVKLLPALMAEFEQAKREQKGMVSGDLAVALAFREEMRKADNADNYDLSEIVSGLIHDKAEAILLEGGETREAMRKANDFSRIANGAETLSEAFEDWLTRGNLPPRTQLKYRTALTEFASFVGGHPLIADMNRSNAVGYVDWLNREGRSQRTKKAVPLSFNSKRDRVMALSAFWNKGLSARNKVSEQVNPWSKLEVTEKPTSSATQWDDMSNVGRPRRRPYFDDTDLLAILDAPGPRQTAATRYTKATLLEVLTLGLLTGARPDEMCSLHLKGIREASGGYLLSIEDAKNAESDRVIPVVHPIAVGILRRRIGKRTKPEEQLFAEFRPKEGHDNMAELVLRALGRHLERAADLQPGAVPYCTRHTLQTLMGNQEDVKDAVMQRYVGHKPAGMTDKHYRSISAESLLGFAKKIKYADKVEKRMAKELGLPMAAPARIKRARATS